MKTFSRFLCLLLVTGCASTAPERKKLEDGSYELKCSGSLATCLAEFEPVCGQYGYDVIRGRELRERFGPEEMKTEYATSDARVRCRRPRALLVGGEGDVQPPSVGAKPTAAPTSCFPGSTQPCLGPGACSGAQVCNPDGRAFGACDCGGTASADAGAGPPPPATETWSVPDAGVPSDAGAAGP